MKSTPKTLSVENCKDSGLALVLIGLLCFQIWELPILILFSIFFLLVAMTWPFLFKPFARFWFALSGVLGAVLSRIILTGLFFSLVLPVGLARRALGKDAMQIKCWKKENKSVFRVRNHLFIARDLDHPY